MNVHTRMHVSVYVCFVYLACNVCCLCFILSFSTIPIAVVAIATAADGIDLQCCISNSHYNNNNNNSKKLFNNSTANQLSRCIHPLMNVNAVESEKGK